MKADSTKRNQSSLFGALALAGALALTLSAIAPMSALAQDAETINVGTASDDLGTYLVGPEGNTLYYFTRDVAPGASVCEGGCLEAWPPLYIDEGQQIVVADGAEGTFGSALRDDGRLHATYRGRPLYYFVRDEGPGDTNGQDVGNVWFVATTDGSMPANPPALTLQTTTNELGTFLTGRDGLTIYYFGADAAPGVSVCEGGCLEAWPPVTIPSGNSAAAADDVPGVVGLITGTDGSTQVTYDGRPLYYWQGDTEAGQTNGHEVNDIWWVADVSGNLPIS